jgi:hypothetical protein
MAATLWVVLRKRRLKTEIYYKVSHSTYLYSLLFLPVIASSILLITTFSDVWMIRSEVLCLHTTTSKILVRFTRHELLQRFPRLLGCMPVTFSTNALAGGRFFTVA